MMFADGEITEFINRIKNAGFGMTLDEQLHLLEQFDYSQKEIERLRSVEKA
jgi:nicotinic acid phosphoribosyltransferase